MQHLLPMWGYWSMAHSPNTKVLGSTDVLGSNTLGNYADQAPLYRESGSYYMNICIS